MAVDESTVHEVLDGADVVLPRRSPHTGREVELSGLEVGILAFERRRWRSSGPKEAGIARELGLYATRYYQILNVLLDDERALAWDPILVRERRSARGQRRHLR